MLKGKFMKVKSSVKAKVGMKGMGGGGRAMANCHYDVNGKPTMSSKGSLLTTSPKATNNTRYKGALG